MRALTKGYSGIIFKLNKSNILPIETGHMHILKKIMSLIKKIETLPLF
jgi:hypothetical protein